MRNYLDLRKYTNTTKQNDDLEVKLSEWAMLPDLALVACDWSEINVSVSNLSAFQETLNALHKTKRYIVFS